MRWVICVAALVLGFTTAALASGGLPAPTVTRTCPHGYALHHHRHGNPAWLCVRTPHTPTVTVSGPTRTVSATVTAPAVTTTLPATTLPGTTEMATATVTTPPTTVVSTETDTLPQATVTLPATTITDTQTVTVASMGTASLAWCGGHGGNWNASGCTAPPNPLTVPVGGSVELDAASTGSLVSEPFPLGYLTYTVAGPPGAVWSEYDQEYGLNPAASQDCSRVENFSGQAEGGCLYVFGTPGAYVVTVGFVDTDGNYGYPVPISTTINAG